MSVLARSRQLPNVDVHFSGVMGTFSPSRRGFACRRPGSFGSSFRLTLLLSPACASYITMLYHTHTLTPLPLASSESYSCNSYLRSRPSEVGFGTLGFATLLGNKSDYIPCLIPSEAIGATWFGSQ